MKPEPEKLMTRQELDVAWSTLRGNVWDTPVQFDFSKEMHRLITAERALVDEEKRKFAARVLRRFATPEALDPVRHAGFMELARRIESGEVDVAE